MSHPTFSSAIASTEYQCPVCEPRWDLLPFECECDPLPPITASAYVPTYDSVPHAPTAEETECDVCGEYDCTCEWPRDSDGNLIPADEYCHECKGNLMECDCDDARNLDGYFVDKRKHIRKGALEDGLLVYTENNCLVCDEDIGYCACLTTQPTLPILGTCNYNPAYNHSLETCDCHSVVILRRLTHVDDYEDESEDESEDEDEDDTPSPFADFNGPSLWEAAMKAFVGNSIPNKFTVRCYTPFQEDYTRILICSCQHSFLRYEVYSYHIPEKKQHVLFYVTYDLATIKSTPQKLPTFIDATFLPTCVNVHEILVQLHIPLEDTAVGIWGPAPLQDAWYEFTLQEAIAAPIKDGQPCIVHDNGLFEDIPCILFM